MLNKYEVVWGDWNEPRVRFMKIMKDVKDYLKVYDVLTLISVRKIILDSGAKVNIEDVKAVSNKILISLEESLNHVNWNRYM